ncbi:MAG: hypothetical protein WD081_03800 [Gammaproteobacteria bacterium]
MKPPLEPGLTLTGADSEWFWMMTQAAILLITLLLIFFKLRATATANAIIALQQFEEKWNTPAMARARFRVCQDFLSEVVPPDHDVAYHERRVLDFFEEMAIYTHHSALTNSIAWETYSSQIECYWIMLDERVRDLRVRYNGSSYYERFESLAKWMQSESDRRDGPNNATSEATIRSFATSEVARLQDQADIEQFKLNAEEA